MKFFRYNHRFSIVVLILLIVLILFFSLSFYEVLREERIPLSHLRSKIAVGISL